MRSIEDSGLGSTTPVLSQPGRFPINRIFIGRYRGPFQNGCPPAPSREMFAPSVGLQTCDADGSGGIICQSATPVSAMRGLNGLGGLGVAGCKSLDLALDSLRQTMKAAEEIGVSSAAYEAAKNSTVWDIVVVIPYIGSDCEGLTAEAIRLERNLRASLDSGTQATLAPPAEIPSTPSDKVADTVKFVAVAVGITVAVGGVIYLVGPLVRAASKAGARALR